MVWDLRLHRANDGHVVDVACRLLEQVTHGNATFTILPETKGAFHRRAGATFSSQAEVSNVLSVPLVECWFGVKRVDLARAAVHEQVNDMLGTGREMRRLGLKWGGAAIGSSFLRRQGGHPQHGEPHATSKQQVAACQVVVFHVTRSINR